MGQSPSMLMSGIWRTRKLLYRDVACAASDLQVDSGAASLDNHSYLCYSSPERDIDVCGGVCEVYEHRVGSEKHRHAIASYQVVIGHDSAVVHHCARSGIGHWSVVYAAKSGSTSYTTTCQISSSNQTDSPTYL